MPYIPPIKPVPPQERVLLYDDNGRPLNPKCHGYRANPPPPPPPLRYVNEDVRPRDRNAPPTHETLFSFQSKYDFSLSVIIFIVFAIGFVVGEYIR